MLNLRPILSALRQHKSAAGILLLEIALTCAILCNALFLIQRRFQALQVVSGVDEAHLVNIRLTGIGRNHNALAQTRTDLAALRALPGVVEASQISQLPMVNNSWNSGVSASPGDNVTYHNATMYLGGERVWHTLGSALLAGRDFASEEFIDVPDEAAMNEVLGKIRSIIITRSLADKLYPGESAVGKPLYFDTQPITIVGVIDNLLRPSHEARGPQRQYDAMLLPMRLPYTLVGNYLLRLEPGHSPEVALKAAGDTLKQLEPRRILIAQQTFAEIRHDYFAEDRAMIWLLGIVAVVLLAVTAFGIVGLASFWVQQRTRQIGIRRALGATRGDILRYFQSENFLIVSGGIVLGLLLAFGLNQFLMAKYELPRLPWQTLPIAAVVLWLLGQIAVLAPALRAAAIPPAIATRSV